MVTVGEKEKAIMKGSANDIVASNPNCKELIISNMGHGVSLANPDFFNQMVEEWIHKGNISKDVEERLLSMT